MKTNESVLQEVEKMTEEQQNRIYKLGVIKDIISLIVAVPLIIIGIVRITRSFSDIQTILLTVLVLAAIELIFIGIISVACRIICRDYTDARWDCISKMKKQERNK